MTPEPSEFPPPTVPGSEPAGVSPPLPPDDLAQSAVPDDRSLSAMSRAIAANADDLAVPTPFTTRQPHATTQPPSPTADAAPANSSGGMAQRRRVVGIDVVRAVALIGVVTMNYHGYLFTTEPERPSFAERVFNPWTGVLSTRFAATFVTVAGIGVTLLTRRSVASGMKEAITEDRWRLRRRGLLLFTFGMVFDWIWPGTILPHYGIFFALASFIFTWRARWLVALATAVAAASVGLRVISIHRALNGGTLWTDMASGSFGASSPRDFAAGWTLGGTHPAIPWMVFLIAGMLLGRALPRLTALRWRLIGAGVAMVAAGYIASTVLRRMSKSRAGDAAVWLYNFAATDPFSRQILYLVTTLGSSIVAVVVISQLAERFADSRLVRLFAHAGQMSLTLYVLHVFVFNEIVNQRRWIHPTGLDTALVFAGGYWVAAIAFGALWHRFLGAGPLERIYRRFGG